MPVKLTKRVIDALKAPERGSTLLRDSEVMGFLIRVQAPTEKTPEGARTFAFNYHAHGVERRITIGQFPTWSCEAARERAKELRKLVDKGEDPALAKREAREAPTVSDLAERYERDHLPKKSATSNDKRIIDLHILPRLRNRLVGELHAGDVVALHKAVTERSGPVIANRVLAVLSKMFSLSLVPCEGETKPWRDAVAGNPCKGVPRNPEHGRERFYSATELAAIGEALASYPNQNTADCVRFILLTGARPSEAMRAKWTDIKEGVWTRHGSTTKTKTTHRLPLPPPALELLDARRDNDSEFVFPGHGCDHIVNLRKVWAHVRKLAKIDGRLYDCRHSYASILAAGGTSLFIIGKLLGHSNVRTTQRYSHLSDDPLRDAARKVGDTISASLQRESGKVISMKR